MPCKERPIPQNSSSRIDHATPIDDDGGDRLTGVRLAGGRMVPRDALVVQETTAAVEARRVGADRRAS
jgi:hypothetical protein